MTPEQALLESQTAVEMITVVIDGFEVTVPKGTLVIRAAEKLGIQIPRFCDHPLLEPAGACRQCLVDIEINGRAFPKPQASCTIPVENNMIVKTQLTSPVAEKAQAGIMEFLLINHPLDCPVCDKGGECPLQNQAMSSGRPESRFEGVKRTFEKPVAISSQVLLDRERCVLCARCTRFSEQIAGDPFITLNERGALQQVGIYEEDPFESYYSGNTVQICPVGALTGTSYRFRARPFDLVSVDSACEHCASGCAMRTDIRRGKTLRRLAGDDSSVNEEWNCDKGRWAFKYLTSRERVTSPMIRGEDGELHEASWPEAIAFAANGLKGKRAGVLVGGRATVEDAYGYSKFARVALKTNDIDFRSRPYSEEETSFLSSTALGLKTTYKDIDKADQVVLLGFEPEEESPIVFLRIYKQFRKRALKVISDAPVASRGSVKLNAELVSDIKSISGITSKSVILVGERLSEKVGALTSAVELAEKSGAKLAWIPRRAGERGALSAGAIATLLPGGRPVSEASARVDVAAAWSVDSLPTNPGRSTSEILHALVVNNLDAVVIGGVDPLDISSDALSQLLNSFVVSLEISHSAVTAVADVVLPVAAVIEKSGSFQDWQGSTRNFDKAIADSLSRSDVRILSMIADEMESPINLPTVAATAREISALGNWDGKALTFEETSEVKPVVSEGKLHLTSWRLLLDLGTLQEGEANLAGTARKATARISKARANKLGVNDGELISISSDLGSLKLPVEISEMSDDAIWVPRNSIDSQVIANLGFVNGQVTVVKA
ncbi:NADH dehydrogenase subunit G [freshwater metagenome]|uniref:NADH dehydrogenase subunit G n=1 Tax=freshwater metagenome TaxID=449393 RepID=A0A094SS12_9ZZZZ